MSKLLHQRGLSPWLQYPCPEGTYLPSGMIYDLWFLQILDQRGLLLSSAKQEPHSQGIILLSAVYALELDIQEHPLQRCLGPQMLYFNFVLKTHLPGGLHLCIQRN